MPCASAPFTNADHAGGRRSANPITDASPAPPNAVAACRAMCANGIGDEASATPITSSRCRFAAAATGAGMSDGRYWLGPLAVDVVDGVARVADTDTIAGSTATMDHQFRFAVAKSGLPRDEALMAAVRQASVNPARALRFPGGELVAGAPADLVALDADLAVTQVMRHGEWI